MLYNSTKYQCLVKYFVLMQGDIPCLFSSFLEEYKACSTPSDPFQSILGNVWKIMIFKQKSLSFIVSWKMHTWHPFPIILFVLLWKLYENARSSMYWDFYYLNVKSNFKFGEKIFDNYCMHNFCLRFGGVNFSGWTWLKKFQKMWHPRYGAEIFSRNALCA